MSILLSGCHQRISRDLDGTSDWPPTVLTDIDRINNLTASKSCRSLMEEPGIRYIAMLQSISDIESSVF